MRRERLLEVLRERAPWDLIIVGGGATGLGAALDAATRGHRAVVIESGDIARGTSSRSTKLVHGGIRYLARGEFHLVREALLERGLLLRNAPHLVHSRSFLVPCDGPIDVLKYAAGLRLYDYLAGGNNLGWSHRVSRDEALRLAPTLRPDRLRGGVVYQDGQFDDSRLSIALTRTLFDRGGLAINYMTVTGFVHDRGKLVGVIVRDEESGQVRELRGRVVVNAAGVGSDAVRRLDDPSADPWITPSRGSHIVLDRSFLPGDTGIVVPRTRDGRVLFLIPWEGRVLLGTTDVPTEQHQTEPRPSAEEIAYLLEYASEYLTSPPQSSDIQSQFAGLRPLLRKGAGVNTARLSREHVVRVSESGLVTVLGGKWTTYRTMAADVVDRAARVAGLPERASTTAGLPLHGAADNGRRPEFPLYGSDGRELARLAEESAGGWDHLDPALPYREAEVTWAARHELARNVDDVLSRRTRALLLDARASLRAAPRVAELLARELGRDETWRQEQVQRFQDLARGYLPNSTRTME